MSESIASAPAPEMVDGVVTMLESNLLNFGAPQYVQDAAKVFFDALRTWAKGGPNGNAS